MRKSQKGFTLIELLIVVAIIGIIAAIAIPNLLNAIDRGKQKRTMADMRSIGTAVESYAVDQNVYPVAASSATLATLVQ
ncbi:MAG TPA: prepilin-type N-terminal cleavage/methylation domain-containing protein, partial [Candidatus Polarisedimenticolaceae bacterium]|nr:prepilin-type N-terminal cleavage/methylation domain-containing protein [Candidatus Polarisedimenticolaceae bacterium]